jgi:hypothetical protein
MKRLVFALLLTGAFGCHCDNNGGDDAGPLGSGRVFTRAADEGGQELVLADLGTPLRALQIDVRVSGARVTGVQPAGAVSLNLLEAALDEPKSDLTLVLSDVRRLLLNDGPAARLVTDGPGALALSRAIGIDDDGKRIVLETSTD